MSPKTKEVLHIYRRVSTKGQEDKYSLGVQLKKGKKLSEKLGLNFKDWNEKGMSGSGERIEDREVLSELFIHIQEGFVKHLFVQDLSRLSRNPLVSGSLRVELERNGVQLYTDNSEIDFKSDEQVLLYDFLSSVNQFFVKVQTKKSKQGKVEHFKRGGYRGGTFPMGYKSRVVNGIKKLVVVPKESEYIRKIFEWYDNDKTVKQIGRLLDKDGFQPRRGETWVFQSIVNILQNPLYIGIDTMKDSTKTNSDGSHPILKNHEESFRIVSDEIFNRVQTKIENILTIRNQLKKMKHEVLLRGNLWCGSCGSIFGVRIKPSKNERYYYCRSKENNWRELDKKKWIKCECKKSINIPNTDKIIWDTLVQILGDSHHIKEVIKQQEFEKKKELQSKTDNSKILKTLEGKKRVILRKIKDLDERGEENREWYLGGEITKQQYQKGNQVVEKRKSDRWKEYREIDLQIQSIRDKKLWIDWLETHSSWVKDIENIQTTEDRREVLNQYVNRIKVFYHHPPKNHHSLEINLKIPMVNDTYHKLDKVKGKTDYEILSGSSYFSTKVLPTKRGRTSKKKVKNEGVVKSNIQEDTRIPPTDSNPSPSNSVVLLNGEFFLNINILTKSQLLYFPYGNYSPYQEELFNLCTTLHKEGLGYRKISHYLNGRGYKSVRGKIFKNGHIQSILNKGLVRKKRIKNMKSHKDYGYEFSTYLTE
jgi:site-specific DNA recombinase